VIIFNRRFIVTAVGAVLSSLIMYLLISHSMIFNFNVIISIIIGAGVYSTVFFLYTSFVKHFFHSLEQ
jgi:preprotein translocase subunit SecF